jgi:hypothetical protein
MIKGPAVRKSRAFLVLPVVMALYSCGGTAPREVPVDPSRSASSGEMNTPLRSFAQEITSSVTGLRMKPSEATIVPIMVRNIGQETLASSGKYPVTVSYKWFESGKILPIEGDRTLLPNVLQPNESSNVNLKVTAPSAGKSMTLKITLVQEGVQWFMTAGAPALELPVTLVR